VTPKFDPARQRAERTGRRAESLAVFLLRIKGYRILARRYRGPGGEIDIVAQRGKTLVFVEVKARASRAAAPGSLSVRQRDRIINAAQAFIAGRADLAQLGQRFDLVIAVPGRLPHHLKNAWTQTT
jgi:putative endonuclease